MLKVKIMSILKVSENMIDGIGEHMSKFNAKSLLNFHDN